MAKQVKKGEPLTPEEQAKLNKLYNSQQAKEDRLKPGELAEILDEHLEAFRKGDTSIPVSFMGKKEQPAKPKEESKPAVVKSPSAKETVKQEPAKVEPTKPVEKKIAVKAVVETKPAEKVKVQDTRGFNKKGKQTVASKVAQKVTTQQTFRRGAEVVANNLLAKVGSSLRFKKALKNPVIGK